MSPITYTRATADEQLAQILALQARNSKEQQTEQTVREEGFITVRHKMGLLKRMNKCCPHILAMDGAKVAGYALCMHPKFEAEIPIIAPMFKRARRLLPNKNFIVMGQVCIGKKYRKKGVFRKLYEVMWEAVHPEYDCIVTEVDNNNQRSLKAHLGIGFKVLETYTADEREWHLISLG